VNALFAEEKENDRQYGRSLAVGKGRAWVWVWRQSRPKQTHQGRPTFPSRPRWMMSGLLFFLLLQHSPNRSTCYQASPL